MAASHACRPCRNHFRLALIAPAITRLTSPESAACHQPPILPRRAVGTRIGTRRLGTARYGTGLPGILVTSQLAQRTLDTAPFDRSGTTRCPNGKRSYPEDRHSMSSRRTKPARWRRRHFSTALSFASARWALIHRHDTPSCLAQINIAMDALPVEISRPAKPSWTAWTSSNAQHII